MESMIEICRDHSRNVKRWRDGTMALRWCPAGSTATLTFPGSEPLSNGMSRSKKSEPTTTITPRTLPDDHRAAA